MARFIFEPFIYLYPWIKKQLREKKIILMIGLFYPFYTQILGTDLQKSSLFRHFLPLSKNHAIRKKKRGGQGPKRSII